MTLTIKTKVLDGKHKFWWFLLFDICDLFNIRIKLDSPKLIKNWHVNFSDMDPTSIKYLFCTMIYEMEKTGRAVKSVSRDGVVKYGDVLNSIKERGTTE